MLGENEDEDENEEEDEGVGGVYSRPTVPDSVYTGDSHSCNRPTTVPHRPNRPNVYRVEESGFGFR